MPSALHGVGLVLYIVSADEELILQQMTGHWAIEASSCGVYLHAMYSVNTENLRVACNWWRFGRIGRTGYGRWCRRTPSHRLGASELIRCGERAMAPCGHDNQVLMAVCMIQAHSSASLANSAGVRRISQVHGSRCHLRQLLRHRR
jgi:hypothetical protein